MAAVSLLAAVSIPLIVRASAKASLSRCLVNLGEVNRAVLQFANDRGDQLPRMENHQPPGGWWWYKDEVKAYLGLSGPSSTNDVVFACPNDRGYGDGLTKSQPFCRSARHNYTSYVFNGVNLPGVPNIGGKKVAAIREPNRTLLVMEWTAHAPLSWHRSLTGKRNSPFYCDAESVVGFVDGHVGFIKVYYDGMNPAYTRDPIPGYNYMYSGD